jgi:glycosyltransferase involved in cell wall biosynthesis
MSGNQSSLSAEKYSYHLPVNAVSFGQVSVALLREIRSRIKSSDEGAFINLFLIGDSDLSTQPENQDFSEWVEKCSALATEKHNRENPLIKLWHLYDTRTLSSVSRYQKLITFHELDQLTPLEKNVARNIDEIYLTSKYSVDVFKEHGIDNVKFLPLGFDHHNFFRTDKKYFNDDRVTFNLVGKFEKRKNHKEVIQAWIKRFGNDNRYFLQCSIHNTFLTPEQNNQIFSSIVAEQRCSNITFLTFMGQNAQYNDFLNSGDIVIGASGGEGWGLPEFHSVGLGKYGVIMNETGYKSWANESNSVLINPGSKDEIYDNMFFRKGNAYNQGNYFTLDVDSFIHGCEQAIEKCRENRVNEAGLSLQKEFTWAKTLDALTCPKGMDSVSKTKAEIEASSPYNDGWTREHYRKILNEEETIEKA